MTRHRIAQIGENRNPKSPENRPQTRRFLQIRLLQLRRSATPFNGLAVLHGRLSGIVRGRAGSAVGATSSSPRLFRNDRLPCPERPFVAAVAVFRSCPYSV